MYKPTTLAALCIFSLGACTVDYAQTGEELVTLANTSGFYKSNSYQVPRSAADVSRSLQAGANKCLNQRSTGVIFAGTHMGAPITYNTVSDFSATVSNIGNGRSELSLRMVSHGFHVGPKEPEIGEIVYTAFVTPVSGGARIDEAWMVMSLGASPIATGVRAWADGTSTACPSMPR